MRKKYLLTMVTIAASRLTRKYQATIPADVRRALRLKQGDVVQFEIDGDRVTLRRQEDPTAPI